MERRPVFKEERPREFIAPTVLRDHQLANDRVQRGVKTSCMLFALVWQITPTNRNRSPPDVPSIDRKSVTVSTVDDAVLLKLSSREGTAGRIILKHLKNPKWINLSDLL